MKINEKNLCMFATTPPVDREGWLLKRGEVNKNWQRRYFVLKGNLLFYFEKKGDKEPLGVIILEGCTIELAEDGEQYCFQIVFHGINNRTYFLSAVSQEQMEVWMKALTCAGYEYMKLMVAELQRQLDEIEETKDTINTSNESNDTAATPRPPPRRQNPFNRPAPPPPTFNVTSVSKTQNSSSDTKATSPSVGGGTSNNQMTSSASTPLSSANFRYDDRFRDPPSKCFFLRVHDTFGRQILPYLAEREKKKQQEKERAAEPLIDLRYC